MNTPGIPLKEIYARWLDAGPALFLDKFRPQPLKAPVQLDPQEAANQEWDDEGGRVAPAGRR